MPENELRFPRDFFIRHVRLTIQQLRDLVEFRGYTHIVLDLRAVTTCFPDAMLPIISIVRKYQDEGVRFTLLPPTYESLRRTFSSSNWSRHWWRMRPWR
jgi:hypothetical protein